MSQSPSEFHHILTLHNRHNPHLQLVSISFGVSAYLNTVILLKVAEYKSQSPSEFHHILTVIGNHDQYVSDSSQSPSEFHHILTHEK